ncbi:MAG: ABC transporter permease [Anaerolineae bacterium]|nr:ABC transporter permease [Anaerolineae bacterium]
MSAQTTIIKRTARPRITFEGVTAALRFILLDPTLLIAFLLMVLLVGLALLGPLLWGIDPLKLDFGAVFAAPSPQHPMGTDSLGRDIFARFYSGAQISLTVGVVAVVFGAVLGGAVGLIAGMSGGWVDVLLMRTMDAILAFPPLVLAMAITIGLGAGIETAAIAIIVTTIPWYARLVRSDVLRVRSMPFIEAAVAIGMARWPMIRRHVVPHIMPTLLIQAAASFGYAILALAALGFVGLGAQIPTPEWGAMITEGLSDALTGRWWVGVFPGVGILLAVTAANLFADRARDLLDIRAE